MTDLLIPVEGARRRDTWLDAMRSVSITRVLVFHTLARYGESTVVPMSFVLPGMPIVFAVSGAVCFDALSRLANSGTSPLAFYRDRAKRLMIPFWTYALLVLALLFFEAFRSDHVWHRFDVGAVWRWFLPIVEPGASEAWKHLALHLWFMPPFVWILLLAPWLVALHRRWFGAGLGVALAAACFVELSGYDAPGTLRNVLVYSVAFQAGFLLRDDRVPTPSNASAIALAAGGAALGVYLHARLAPGRILNLAPLPHILYGLAMLPLWVVARRWVVAAFALRPIARFSHAVNRRAYTLFLWGPAANELAFRLSLRASGTWSDAVYLAGSAAGILVFAAIFGRVEIASRR